MGIRYVKQFKKIILVIVSTAFFLTACATGQLVGPNKKFKKEDVQGNLTKHEVQVIFFLEKDESNEDKVILVSTGRRLIGGLKKERYIPIKVCTGEHLFTFQRSNGNVNKKATYRDSRNIKVNVIDGDFLYIKASVAKDGLLRVERVTENVALNILENAEYQSYLVNRKINDCTPTPPPIPLESTILEEIELPADALFAFNDATLVELSAKEKLNHIIEKIKASNLNIKNITVVGFTDRIGDEKYNQKLSEKRANTVAHFLKENGIKEEIKAIGLGSANPITQGQCSSQLNRKALIECLQPDRRVSIQLWGETSR